MKLTTQRLKKLIREELEKMNEGVDDLIPELEEIKSYAIDELLMDVGTIQYAEILPLLSNPEEDTEADLYVKYMDDGTYTCQYYDYMGGKKTACPTKDDVKTWLASHKKED